MNFGPVESIANAVLYEGYLLYPYRTNSVKNHQRWNFGVLYPKDYSEPQGGSDSWFMQTECLMRAPESAVLDVKIRFLQAVWRKSTPAMSAVSELKQACLSPHDTDPIVASANAVLDRQEAMEQELNLSGMLIADLLRQPASREFFIPGGREQESSKDHNGASAGTAFRTREPIEVKVRIESVNTGSGVQRLTIVVWNQSSCSTPPPFKRDQILMKSLLSAHIILGIAGGEFISTIDPPADLRELASACKNIGIWPVLAGEPGAGNSLLCSPIILYDYPQIAPESPENLFDGTEIDEILTLRMLTLSEDEKNMIRASDDRARALLERTESMPPEQLLKLHGALRDVKPVDGSGGANPLGGRDG